jgi:hypothetical protein
MDLSKCSSESLTVPLSKGQRAIGDVRYGCSVNRLVLHEESGGTLSGPQDRLTADEHAIWQIIPMNHVRTCEHQSAIGNGELWSRDWYSSGGLIAGHRHQR